jgi:hypothetical protein
MEEALIRFRILARVPFARLMPSSHSSTATALSDPVCDLPNEEESSCPDSFHTQARVENDFASLILTCQFLEP